MAISILLIMRVDYMYIGSTSRSVKIASGHVCQSNGVLWVAWVSKLFSPKFRSLSPGWRFSKSILMWASRSHLIISWTAPANWRLNFSSISHHTFIPRACIVSCMILPIVRQAGFPRLIPCSLAFTLPTNELHRYGGRLSTPLLVNSRWGCEMSTDSLLQIFMLNSVNERHQT